MGRVYGRKRVCGRVAWVRTPVADMAGETTGQPVISAGGNRFAADPWLVAGGVRSTTIDLNPQSAIPTVSALPCGSRLNGFHPSSFRLHPSSFCLHPSAFTLIELIIVTMIIVLLAAILVPAGIGVLDRANVSATRSTLEVLQTAIEQYPADSSLSGVLGRIPPDDFAYGLGNQESYTDQNDNGRWDFGEPLTEYNGSGRYDPAYLNNDIPLFIDVQWKSGGTWQSRPVGQWWEGDYRSIEAMYLYLSRLSPRARTILDKLRDAGHVTNQDTQNGNPCPDAVVLDTGVTAGQVDGSDTWIDLFEVTDAWRRPLKYAFDPPVSSHAEARWELRSAGPDGKFAPMWTPEEQSDDVILRGP